MTEDQMINEMLDEIDAQMRADQAAINAARALPEVEGECPGSGLRFSSMCGYTYKACSVCQKILGPWDWDATPVFGFADQHERELDTDRELD